MQPNYLISQSPEKVVLRNFEGVITSYPEPENYQPGQADSYFKEIFPEMVKKKSMSGISGIMNDRHFNLVPDGLIRISRRQHFAEDPTHATLKDKRLKRDELKERKFQALTNKEQTSENRNNGAGEDQE